MGGSQGEQCCKGHPPPPMGVQSCGRTWGVRSLGVPTGEIRAMGDPWESTVW